MLTSYYLQIEKLITDNELIDWTPVGEAYKEMKLPEN